MAYRNYSYRSHRKTQEDYFKKQKRKQYGVAFPSAAIQEHILLIRFDIWYAVLVEKEKRLVRDGLRRLCTFLDKIDRGLIKIDSLTEDGDIKPTELSEFNFSSTIGFGKGFFQKLNISQENCPKRLREMPDHLTLGDWMPYSLPQTDFVIQLGSSDDYVNRWVYHNSTSSILSAKSTGRSLCNTRDTSVEREDPDVYSCIRDWARITDIDAGFQRIDGRNLLGFNDGISNPKRLSNDVVWTTRADGDEKFTDGTYMVFQKIEHDLDRWLNLSVEKQEEWIGRSKGTGLLLGTLPKNEDRKLASQLHSNNPLIRGPAMKKWKKLYNEQKDPEKKFFSPNQTQYKNIQANCPVWSHVRKANPRQADGAARSLIFRRGYLFIEGGLNGKFNSGLLFICFQRDIEKGFEYIKKNFLNNREFPIPFLRKNLTAEELARRQRSLASSNFVSKNPSPEGYYTTTPETRHDLYGHNTGKEGLSGPSELSAYPEGEVAITTTLGGGYYFIPPIPNKRISDISEQFFR